MRRKEGRVLVENGWWLILVCAFVWGVPRLFKRRNHRGKSRRESRAQRGYKRLIRPTSLLIDCCHVCENCHFPQMTGIEKTPPTKSGQAQIYAEQNREDQREKRSLEF